jgi:hypothetical protein
MNPAGGRRLRAALNHHVSAGDVETTVAAIQAVLANGVSESGEKVLIYN